MSEILPIVKETLEKYKLQYEVLDCDPAYADTAAFNEHYGLAENDGANTIVIMSRKVEPARYVACVALPTTRIDVNKKICQLMEVKRASFADAKTTTKLTGMMIGGVTAAGILDIPVYIDEAVMNRPAVIMGGGNRSTKIKINPRELLKLPNVEIIQGLATEK